MFENTILGLCKVESLPLEYLVVELERVPIDRVETGRTEGRARLTETVGPIYEAIGLTSTEHDPDGPIGDVIDVG